MSRLNLALPPPGSLSSLCTDDEKAAAVATLHKLQNKEHLERADLEALNPYLQHRWRGAVFYFAKWNAETGSVTIDWEAGTPLRGPLRIHTVFVWHEHDDGWVLILVEGRESAPAEAAWIFPHNDQDAKIPESEFRNIMGSLEGGGMELTECAEALRAHVSNEDWPHLSAAYAFTIAWYILQDPATTMERIRNTNGARASVTMQRFLFAMLDN